MRFLFAATILLFSTPLLAQVQRDVINEKGQHFDTPVAHPLSWWTVDPLRLDTTGDLMLGYPADGGAVLSAKDYNVQQEVTVLGALAGHQIVQVIETIVGKPGIRLYGANLSKDRSQWKSLLIQESLGDYVEIYQLHAGLGTYSPLKPAAIFGMGNDAVLGTDDQDSGNGGGCADGYWWFDHAGAHTVDFGPVYAAMHKAAPAISTFTTGCWTMHPAEGRIETWVQKNTTDCRACGGLGELRATYVIRHGVATPTNVRFTPDPQ